MAAIWRGHVRALRTVTAPIPALRPPPLALFYNDTYEVPLPEQHRFPMRKYAMTRKRVESILSPGKMVTFEESPLATEDDLATTHCPLYTDRFVRNQMTRDEMRRIGFPWSEAVVARTLSSAGGTISATHRVLTPGGPLITGQLAGGTHHAFFDRGEGYCIFNDCAVAANVALRDYPDKIKNILVIDLDVHQGNGTAKLFEHDSRVFTFSLHCRRNLFSERQTSDLDIDLEPGVGDKEYLAAVSDNLPALLDGAAAGGHPPDLIFFQAGVDISQYDRLGHLKVTEQGLKRRNLAVLEGALKRRIPTVVTMGGGYPKDLNPTSEEFQKIVKCHADVYVHAAQALARHQWEDQQYQMG